MSLPSHLQPATDCVTETSNYRELCRGTCSAPVRQDATSGRWYVTMGHPGFNSPANNRSGYVSEAKALASLRMYANRGTVRRTY